MTEMVTGIDLVKEQINIAAGLSLSMKQEDVKPHGWAIECRINAENPLKNFMPSPGTLTGYRSPGGVGIRVDSGVYNGYTIPDCYHPMISKLVAWGRDRNECILRMRRALYEYIIVGVDTNIVLHKAIMENPRFVSGALDTDFITREVGLLADMQRIKERDKSLGERLSMIFSRPRIIRLRLSPGPSTGSGRTGSFVRSLDGGRCGKITSSSMTFAPCSLSAPTPMTRASAPAPPWRTMPRKG